MPISACVSVCLEHPQFDGGVFVAVQVQWSCVGCWQHQAELVGCCQQQSISNCNLLWPVAKTQLWPCQASLSTVAGSNMLYNGPFQHTALSLSPQSCAVRWAFVGRFHDSRHTTRETTQMHTMRFKMIKF